jgi:hypothetical protein
MTCIQILDCSKFKTTSDLCGAIIHSDHGHSVLYLPNELRMYGGELDLRKIVDKLNLEVDFFHVDSISDRNIHGDFTAMCSFKKDDEREFLFQCLFVDGVYYVESE